MIRHVVFFKFKPDVTAHERESAIADLRALPDKIDFIRGFETGLDALGAPRSWDGALIATFDDLEMLEKYARHDDHVPVVMRMQSLCEAIGSVDFEM